MRNKLGITLALTSVLAFGGMALAKTHAKAKPQNSNTPMTGGTNTGHKRHHRKHHRRVRRHRKAASTNANR